MLDNKQAWEGKEGKNNDGDNGLLTNEQQRTEEHQQADDGLNAVRKLADPGTAKPSTMARI